MKISTAILKKLGACSSGFDVFKKAHGDHEILFSDCVKSESNSVADYFWFIRTQQLTAEQKKDLQLLAIEFAESVLPIFEAKHPDDNRPRASIEAVRAYLSGMGELTINYSDAVYAAYNAAYAASAAYAAVAAVATDAERSWQKQRLADMMVKWGW